MKKWYRGLSLASLRERVPALERAASKAEANMDNHNTARADHERRRVMLAQEYFVLMRERSQARKELAGIKDAIADMEARATQGPAPESLEEIVARRKAAYKGEGPAVAAPVDS